MIDHILDQLKSGLEKNLRELDAKDRVIMNKFNQFLASHGTKVMLVFLVLIYFKSCGINSDLDKVKKDYRALKAEVDTLTSTIDEQTVNEEEMIHLIKTVPAWKTLRIEEISDKERISINALEEKED